MGGSANRYTLNIIVSESDVIPFAKGSIETIDEVTSNFKSSSELWEAIKSALGLSDDYKNIRLSLTYNQNKEKRYVRILYEADKFALDRSKVAEKFSKYISNKEFVIKFVKRYDNNPYMSVLAKEVIVLINGDEDYTGTLQRIVNLAFNNYKAVRDIYFFIKDYEKEIRSKTNDTISIPVVDKKNDLTELLKKLEIVYMVKQLNFFDIIDKEIRVNPGVSNNFIPQVKKKVLN